MLLLRPDRLKDAAIPTGTAWLLADCMEAKGKQDLWLHQRSEVLTVLREQAIVQSTESSNRIEGVTVAAERLRPLVLGKARPRDRSEEEVAGYRKALSWVFTRKNTVLLEPRVILHLHSLAQGGSSGDAGQWKERDNEIIEILPNGERRIRFKPTLAKRTPRAIETLCRHYREACDKGDAPALLVVATCVLDFLCVHPFRDGNGRISRLLTTLLLEQSGFLVCRYVSAERLIEESKEEYYDVLARCSKRWHDGANQIVPWWNYFLSIVRRAYGECARKVEAMAGPRAKSDLVRQVVQSQIGEFALAELKAQLPSVSEQLIRKVLSDLKKTGGVKLTGRGRGARWRNLPAR